MDSCTVIYTHIYLSPVATHATNNVDAYTHILSDHITVLGILGKLKGQVLHVAPALHVLFCNDDGEEPMEDRYSTHTSCQYNSCRSEFCGYPLPPCNIHSGCGIIGTEISQLTYSKHSFALSNKI